MAQIGPGFLSLPDRPTKPRSDGLTHVLDKGLSQIGLESLIQTAGDSHRHHQARLGHRLRVGRREGEGGDVPRRRYPALPRRHAAGDLRIAEPDHRLRPLAAPARRHPRRGVQRRARHAHRPEARADLDARREFTVLSECGSKNPKPRGRLRRLGRRDAWRPGRRSVAADRRGQGERHRRAVPAQRRGPFRAGRGADRGAPRGADHLRGAAQGPAGLVHPSARSEGQPGKHPGGRGDRAGDAAPRAAVGHPRPAAGGHRRAPAPGPERRGRAHPFLFDCRFH